MGFIVKQPIETFLGNSLDSFYVRIERYTVDKWNGLVEVSIAWFENPEAAAAALPKYIEDKPVYYGRVPTSMSYNGISKDWEMCHNFPLHEKITLIEPTFSSSYHSELIDYVDFDENGEEIIKQREEWFETVFTGSQEITKTLKNVSSLTGSIYEFSYGKLKEVYSDIFGSENIIDKI
jgi:hypothetical protein